MNNKVRITYNDGKQMDVLKNTKIVDAIVSSTDNKPITIMCFICK